MQSFLISVCHVLPQLSQLVLFDLKDHRTREQNRLKITHLHVYSSDITYDDIIWRDQVHAQEMWVTDNTKLLPPSLVKIAIWEGTSKHDRTTNMHMNFTKSRHAHLHITIRSFMFTPKIFHKLRSWSIPLLSSSFRMVCRIYSRVWFCVQLIVVWIICILSSLYIFWFHWK